MTLKTPNLSRSTIAAASAARTARPYGSHAGTARLGHLRVGFEAVTPLNPDVWMPNFAQEFHRRQVIGKMPEGIDDSYAPLPIGPWAISSSGQTWGVSGVLQFEKAVGQPISVGGSSHIIFGVAKNSRGTETRPEYSAATECMDGTWLLDPSKKHDCVSEVLDNIVDSYDHLSSDDATMLRDLLGKGRCMSNDEEKKLHEVLRVDDGDVLNPEHGEYLVGVLESCRYLGGDEARRFDLAREMRHYLSGANVGILTSVLNHLFFWLSYPASYPHTIGRTTLEEVSFYSDYLVPSADELVEELGSVEYSDKSMGKPRLRSLPGTGGRYVSWLEKESGIERNLFALDRDRVRAEIHFQGIEAVSAAAGASATSRQLPLLQLTRYGVLPVLFALTDAAIPHLRDFGRFLRSSGKSGRSAKVFKPGVVP